MRYTKLALVLFTFAATLCAADPFVGNWKMNLSKSKYTTGTAPKDQTVTITESGSEVTVRVAGTAADGKKIAYGYTMPAGGGTGKIIEGTTYDAMTGKRIGPTEREMNYMKGGKSLYTAHSTLSADGKTLTVHAKGLSGSGQNVDVTAIYDRQ